MPSLAEFQKRFCRRVIGDLPEDLEALECEDALGILRHHVRRLLDRTARHTDRQPAYASRPSFSIPGSPPASRLQSAEGYIPFHFAKNKVEDRTAKEFDAYASGKGQIVPTDLEAGRAVEIVAGIDGAGREAYMASHGGPDGAAPDRWTNLADDPAMRGEQWATIEAFERHGRVNPDGNPPGLNLFYDRAPALFDDVAAQADCPTSLRRLIAKQRARVAAEKPLSQRKARDGIRWIDERAFDVFAWIKTQPDWPEDANKAERPARVSQGRAVQTHLAGEGEYHAALGRKARGRIRDGMIELVQRQRNPTSATEAGWFIPMTICDHRPDGLNDPLNDHFHWLIGTRRARFKEDGGLEFEDRKVDAITRKIWLDVMRDELARLTNVELDRIGAAVRYHPGTLAEMGIDATAQQKMGARRTVLERAGFSTELGLSNDTEGWRRAFTIAQGNHAATLVAIEQEHPKQDERQARARAAKIAAAELRYEAAQVQILIDMSRSRAERTARFAGEYAGAASSPRVIDGWLSRGRDAESYLRQLDIDLAAERAAIAERLAKADRLDVEVAPQIAASLASPIDPRFGQSLQAVSPTRTEDVSRLNAVRPKGDVHRVIDIIAKAPLLVSDVEGMLHVAVRDDPHQLIVGIDLSAAQRRLAGIHRVQQRELAQVQAFARRHGGAALFDDDCETHTVWFQGAMRKWRDAPVMQRWSQELELSRARTRAVDIATIGARFDRKGRELADLPSLDGLSSLDEIPFLNDIPGYHNEEGVSEISAPTHAPASTPAAPRKEDKSRSPRPTIEPDKPSSPEPRWTEIEQRHRKEVDRRATRARGEIDRSIETALVQRTGGRNALTPYAARLLRRIENGLDPANVPRKIGPAGQTLDQRYAAEILVLSREPAFRARVEAAQHRDAALSAEIADAMRYSTPPDLLGRVGVEHDRLQFGQVTREASGGLRTPLEWAEQTTALVIEHGIPLSRHKGLTGIYDAEVLTLSHYNYAGLLHPSVQSTLEVEQRIQAEQMRAILGKVQAGALKVETSIAQIPLSDMISTSVRVLNGTAEERAFVFRRQSDAALYLESRKAQAAGSENIVPLRHASAVVRAWLLARDDGASSQVMSLFAEKLRALSKELDVVGMPTSDARALTDVLAPPTFEPVRPIRRGSRVQVIRNEIDP